MTSGLTLAMPAERIALLVARQVGNLFELDPATEAEELKSEAIAALHDLLICFRPCRSKYFRINGTPHFDPYNTSQYTIFLYFLSRRLVAADLPSLADRVYYLNKALNGVDLYHAVRLPSVFFVDHPVGSVIGRAAIGEGFVFCQNCTVGNTRGRYPVIGREVTLFAGASIIGDCRIGSRVILGAGALVLDQHVPANSIVTGRSPHLRVQAVTDDSFERRSYFDHNLLPAADSLDRANLQRRQE